MIDPDPTHSEILRREREPARDPERPRTRREVFLRALDLGITQFGEREPSDETWRIDCDRFQVIAIPHSSSLHVVAV